MIVITFVVTRKFATPKINLKQHGRKKIYCISHWTQFAFENSQAWDVVRHPFFFVFFFFFGGGWGGGGSMINLKQRAGQENLMYSLFHFQSPSLYFLRGGSHGFQDLCSSIHTFYELNDG